MNKNLDFINDAALLGLPNSSSQRMGRLQYWWTCHLRAFLFACGELVRYPMSNLMTIFVIGIAFSLPITLFSLLQNAQGIITNWQTAPKILLYLKQDLSANQLNTFIQTLNQDKAIEQVKYISPQQGLQSLQTNGSVDDTSINALGYNPLPGVVEVTPNHLNNTPQQIQLLYSRLKSLNDIQLAELNINWVKRLYYLLETLQYLTMAIATLFAVGLVLIVGNTIRLDLKSNQEEIDVLNLIGATRSFIRRPLLYRGLLYGCIGGAIAWMLCSIILTWLESPVTHLAMSYNSSISLHGLSLCQGLMAIIGGGLLSYLGARIVLK